jgi:hypothetical protein
VVGSAVCRIEVLIVGWVARLLLGVHLGERRGAVWDDVGVPCLSLVVHPTVIGLVKVIVESYCHTWVGAPDPVSIEGEVILGEGFLVNCIECPAV